MRAIRLAGAIDRLWRAGFWILLALSFLWLAAAFAGWILMALALANNWPFMIQPRRYDSFIGVLVRSIIIVQPPIIAWLLWRAFRDRNVRRGLASLASAAAPLGFVVALIAAVQIGHYLEQRAIRQSLWTKQTIHTLYVCEHDHASPDFDPDRLRAIDLRLDAVKAPGAQTVWTVLTPVRLAGRATAFPTDTGSIGGSEGFRWRTADRRTYVAQLSFSDVIGESGPDTLWVRIFERGEQERRPEDDKFANLTCGPAEQERW